MKLAISVREAEAGTLVDLRFGRTRFFRIVDTETGEQTLLDNAAGIRAAQGAGTQAAQKLAREGVRAVLTGHVGPKAWSALQAAGIAVHCVEGGTAEQVIEAFLSGRLQAMSPKGTGNGNFQKANG